MLSTPTSSSNWLLGIMHPKLLACLTHSLREVSDSNSRLLMISYQGRAQSDPALVVDSVKGRMFWSGFILLTKICLTQSNEKFSLHANRRDFLR